MDERAPTSSRLSFEYYLCVSDDIIIIPVLPEEQDVIGVPRLSRNKNTRLGSKHRVSINGKNLLGVFVLVCTTMRLIYLCFFLILHQLAEDLFLFVLH